MKRAVLFLMGLAAAAGLTACEQQVRGGEAVRSELYVLVDLSETWFNNRTEAHNRQVLAQVARGAGLVAPEVAGPYLVQYRAIGNQAYLRDPLCSVVFAQGLKRNRKDEEVVNRPANVEKYLNGVCLDRVMVHPPEGATQISAAVASVSLEPRPAAGGKRWMIIASDFLEETQEVAPIEPGSLSNVNVLLLYRPLTDDQASPAAMGARISDWKARLEASGAKVQTAPDTSIRPSQIVSFLMS